MPPSRREQLELDELLKDLYRGIEALPDNNGNRGGAATSSAHTQQPGNRLASTSYVKEYELPASSPLVRDFKRDVARHNNQQQQQQQQHQQQPQRSTLKRSTNTPENRQPQSLGAFLTSTTPTPESKRRVRIVDENKRLANHSDGGDDDESNDDDDDDADYNDYRELENIERRQKEKPGKVRYVNTNKLIYHQETNPDDNNNSNSNNNNYEESEESQSTNEDIDGVTRVQYYRTSWLDRQLDRATKRRGSKELNERQVKEKAMIEELKRSLKNGAITLRQSLRGNKHKQANNNPIATADTITTSRTTSSNSGPAVSVNKHYCSTINTRHTHAYDDQIIKPSEPKHSQTLSQRVFSSGLATVPRKYHANKQQTKQQQPQQPLPPLLEPTNQHDSVWKPVNSNNRQQEFVAHNNSPVATPIQTQQLVSSNQQSRTLPHNAHMQQEPHALLQSHYKNGSQLRGSPRRAQPSQPDNMVYHPQSNGYKSNTLGSPRAKTPNTYNNSNNTSCNDHHHQQQQQQQHMNTISSIPSATEVVRTALSRSSSQVSLNQLTSKTINLLPTSPPPHAHSPTQHQLKPATPSLTPSPQPTMTNPHAAYTSKTLGSTPNPSSQHQQQQQQQQQKSHFIMDQPRLHGTRVIQPAQAAQPAQPVYANPHASLMQHRMEQSMRQPTRNNQASLREFNELDTLLRSLSPAGAAQSSATVMPGYSRAPAQPSFGGYMPANYQPPNQQQQQQQQQQLPQRTTDYARPQQQQQQQQQQTRPEQTKASYLRQNFGTYSNTQQQQQQPYTVDVTESRNNDENCDTRRKNANLSEFEPPIELLPSMEDYQNITKLNPVKNYYWYKPNMSRERAINLLKDKPQGTFIVRDSNSFKGAYGLAVKVAKLPKNVLRNPNADPSSELIRHFLIEPTQNGVRLAGYANEPVFGSLPSLVYQHSLTDLALPCKLVIPRADIEDPQFNYKQKQFYDEFIVSKEQAKHEPYERTSPNNGYRRYPGDVYVHNEHRIIFE